MNAGNSSNEDQLENGEQAEESVIHDITGTTVYVVGVICVIPAAGLVAWVVRYVVKKKVTHDTLHYKIIIIYAVMMTISKTPEYSYIDNFVGSVGKFWIRKLF